MYTVFTSVILLADAKYWMNRGMSDLGRRLKMLENPIVGRAKNVVFFLGDGMSLATVTAARIHMEQSAAKSLADGNASLTFEKFPYTGLARVRGPLAVLGGVVDEGRRSSQHT